MGSVTTTFAMVDSRGTQGLLLVWCGRIGKACGFLSSSGDGGRLLQ